MCGIVAIFGGDNIALKLHESLIHLQHRGQDAAGIATFSDMDFHLHTGKGLVSQVFKEEEIKALSGNFGVGHVRYPTAGAKLGGTSQPCSLNSPTDIALAHNGNLINHHHIEKNSINDSMTMLNLFAENLVIDDNSNNFFSNICDSVSNIFELLHGSYSVVAGIKNKGLVAYRDPHGIRPLVLGEKLLDNGKKSYIIASEPTMFYALDYELKRDIKPGEVIYIDLDGNFFAKTLKRNDFVPCIFEYVYFSRADSILDDVSVYRSRLRMGQNLAKRWQEQHPDLLPDVVIPVPYTSNTSALSFASYFNVRYCEALHKNTFINRTFITDGQTKRANLVRHKFTPQPLEIKDKKVMIVDDSIVRGTTSKEIVNMVKEHSPKAVYFASAAPPLSFPCFYGINIPTSEELLAHKMSITEIKEYLGVDELLYQTEDDLTEAVSRRGENHIKSPCLACMNGKYIKY